MGVEKLEAGGGGKLRTATYIKIDDLLPQTVGHNLVVRVLSMHLVVDRSRVDGSEIRIAEVTVGDETGIIILRARDEQIDRFVVGTSVVIRNAGIAMYRGFMRLVVNKWGKISPHPDGIQSTPPAPKTINLEINKSEVEYELVHVGEQAEGEG